MVHIQFVSHEDSSIFTVYVAVQYGLPHFIHKSSIFSYSSVGLCNRVNTPDFMPFFVTIIKHVAVT